MMQPSLVPRCHWYLTERGKANHLHDLQILTRDKGCCLRLIYKRLKRSVIGYRRPRFGFTMQELDHSHIGMATLRRGRKLRSSHPGCCLAPSLFSRRPVLVVRGFLLGIPYSQSVYWARASWSSDLREVTSRRYGQRRGARLLPFESVL